MSRGFRNPKWSFGSFEHSARTRLRFDEVNRPACFVEIVRGEKARDPSTDDGDACAAQVKKS